MILTATLIAMAGGALIGGAKAYRRRKRVVRLGPSPSAPKPGATGAPPPPGNGRAGKTLKKVSLGVRTFFLEETRHRQIQELEGRGDSLITARKQMNRRFSFASANLAVASLSLFFYGLGHIFFDGSLTFCMFVYLIFVYREWLDKNKKTFN